MKPRNVVFALVVAMLGCVAHGQGARRKIIIDRDMARPGGSDELAILVALESPDVDLLGITVESGDASQAEAWRTCCACWSWSAAPMCRCIAGRRIRW
jgi:inosine-uridine nucleoside N-ribohydrolase